MDAIAAESVSKTYKKSIARSDLIHALQGVSLTVENGQIFSLLGPNGAGKTTFIKIILSQTHATGGTASILGVRIPDVKTRAFVGYLPESHRYPGYLTGKQVLQLFGSLSGVSRSELNARIPALLHMVGMTEWKNVKVRKYSKGMLQRIGLAQALINDPRIIFLDEPTDGVDPVGRKEIRDVLKGIRNQGKTIFLNSHLLSEVELISDRVAILDKGKLLKIGTVEELTTTGSAFQIGFDGDLPESVQHELIARLMKPSVSENTLTVELPSTAELNSLIDLLRARSVPIRFISRQRATLEESFMNLVRPETTP
ncbi:MAG: ABC transporter ATP-binding protein [Ignavibacteria bacterium]|nr:ABC transporter ATP-binding protein [Ignavibacteria bacterium]